MSIQELDPWDRPANLTSPMAEQDVARIRDVIREHRFSNPALFPSIHWVEFAALSALALDGNLVAINALRTVERTAEFGGPLESMPRGEVV
jgi:hypothetical protein